MKFLSKTKKKSIKQILMFLLVSTFICFTAISASAVDISNGLEQIITPLKTEVKQVAAICFALLAIVAIAVGVFKIATSFLENHRTNEPINWKPICIAFAAAAVCGLCSATTFFSWFGI